MWANAQRDDRPAEYRWRPLFNATAWLTPTTRVPCSNAAKTQNPLKFAMGCRKLTNRPQPLVGQSSPYCGDMWRRYCCLTSFIQLSIHALVAKIQPDKVVRWCPDGEFLVMFWIMRFQRAARSTFQTCILNLHGDAPCVEV